MPSYFCRHCNQKAEQFGKQIPLGHGASIQWAKCTNCNFIDGIITAGPGEAFGADGNPWLVTQIITLDEIASALKIHIDYEKLSKD